MNLQIIIAKIQCSDIYSRCFLRYGFKELANIKTDINYPFL